MMPEIYMQAITFWVALAKRNWISVSGVRGKKKKQELKQELT